MKYEGALKKADLTVVGKEPAVEKAVPDEDSLQEGVNTKEKSEGTHNEVYLTD